MKKSYEYYIVIYTDSKLCGICYTMGFKLNSIKSIQEVTKKLIQEGYKDPVILNFKLLND